MPKSAGRRATGALNLAMPARGQSVGWLVRSRGLEPPRVAPLAPQASASTNSATTAGDRPLFAPGPEQGRPCNKYPPAGQGPQIPPPASTAHATPVKPI